MSHKETPQAARKWKNTFLALSALLLGLFVTNIALGSVHINLYEIWSFLVNGTSGRPVADTILEQFRLPKAITAVFVGAALGISGLQMQTLFRNPLAGPFVLGISSGAGLGVALTIFLGFHLGFLLEATGLGRHWLLVFSAALGSFSVLFVIMLALNRVRDGVSLLIIGLMFGTVASAIVSVLQFFSRAENIQAYVIWSFGSLGSVSKEELAVLTIVLSLGLVAAFLLSKALNVTLLGDNYAASLGLNLKRSRLLIILNTSLLAGTVTAFCGPIGFLGLAVPHIARMLFNTSNHLLLSPLVMLIGAELLLTFDLIAQLPGMDITLPLNAVTALFGGPFVIWILLRKRSINYSYR